MLPAMPPQMPATSYAILGMLSLAPMSGYELTQSVDKTIAHFWTISKSQVYAELSRLENLGFLRGTEIEQERLPDKRTYELTVEGGRALDEWLTTAGAEYSRLRSVPLLKMFFAHRLKRDAIDELLERHRTDADAARAQLETIVQMLDDVPEAFFARATALVGLRTAEGTVRAIDEIRATVPKQRPKPVAGAVAAAGAKELFSKTPARRRKRGA